MLHPDLSTESEISTEGYITIPILFTDILQNIIKMEAKTVTVWTEGFASQEDRFFCLKDDIIKNKKNILNKIRTLFCCSDISNFDIKVKQEKIRIQNFFDLIDFKQISKIEYECLKNKNGAITILGDYYINSQNDTKYNCDDFSTAMLFIENQINTKVSEKLFISQKLNVQTAKEYFLDLFFQNYKKENSNKYFFSNGLPYNPCDYMGFGLSFNSTFFLGQKRKKITQLSFKLKDDYNLFFCYYDEVSSCEIFSGITEKKITYGLIQNNNITTASYNF